MGKMFGEEKVCVRCGKKLGEGFRRSVEVRLDGESYCAECANEIKSARNKHATPVYAKTIKPANTTSFFPTENKPEDGRKNIILSTTDFLQGYKIVKYMDVLEKFFIVSNSVVNDDIFKQIESRGNNLLRNTAYEYGGNAVIGISYSFTKVHNLLAGPEDLMICAQGTLVKAEKIGENQE